MDHLPYSPYLMPIDFYTFGPLKKHQFGQKFDTIFFNTGIQSWVPWWDKSLTLYRA
jgi:hypothetical protein